MKSLLFIFCSMLISTSLHAQRIKTYISADSCISAGIRAHDDDQYQKAIDWYKKISENDPKYALALYEMGLSFSGLKQYDSVIYYSDKCIALKDPDLFDDAYILKGKALVKKEDYTTAIASYDEALAVYPNNVNLKHFKAVAYRANKEYQKAVDLLLEVNTAYSGYIRNQLEIAEMAENEGMLTQAFLAYTHALLYSIGTDNSINILIEMDKLAAKKLEENPANITFSASGDQFGEIETLLKSQVSLQKKYNLSTEIDFPVVRQLHLLMSQLEKYEPTDGYFDKYYIPFYKELYKEGYFPRLIELLCLKLNNPKVQSSIKRNEKELLEFIDWAQFKLSTGVNKREITVQNQKLTLPCVFNAGVKSCGEYDSEKKKTGTWYYFFSNGNLERMGSLKDGNADGKWEYFYENGKKKAEYGFVSDKNDGPYTSYYQSGNIKEKGAYKEDSFDGEQTKYYENGNIESIGTYVNNKFDGLWKTYYRNGNPRIAVNYKDGKPHGEYVLYASDGKTIVSKYNFNEGKKEGIQEDFFSTGIKKLEAKYVNGKKEGEYKEFYTDGTLSEEYLYENDEPVSDKEYYVNGKLAAIYTYHNGDLETKEVYDYDGVKYAKYLFKNDFLKSVIYFDAEGKEIQKESVGKNDDFVGKWFYSGLPSMRGGYKKGKSHGTWTYFNINGTKDKENNYEKGIQNGIQKNYNNIGKLTAEYEMVDGEYNGYFRKYYESGELSQEGWYESGNKVGYWYDYYIDGTLSEETYYIDDEINGKNIEYDPDGKLFAIYYFKNGDFLYYENYDRDGTLLSKTEIAPKNTSLKPHSKMAFASYKREKSFSYNEGSYYSEPIAGFVEYQGSFVTGNDDGPYINYYKNGAKRRSMNFRLGTMHGADTVFYIQGSPYYTTQYELGYEYKTFKRYYYTGLPWIERTLISDNKDGLETIFGINGDVVLQKFYRLGYLDYIIKNNDQGEFTDTIRVKNETIDYEAKYKNGHIAVKESIKNDESLSFQIYNEKDVLLYSYETDEDGMLKKKEFFYLSGKLLSTETFHKEQSEKKEYRREDGSLILTEEYKYDNIHGGSKAYDESGNLKYHIIYRNGVAYEMGQ